MSQTKKPKSIFVIHVFVKQSHETRQSGKLVPSLIIHGGKCKAFIQFHEFHGVMHHPVFVQEIKFDGESNILSLCNSLVLYDTCHYTIHIRSHWHKIHIYLYISKFWDVLQRRIHHGLTTTTQNRHFVQWWLIWRQCGNRGGKNPVSVQLTKTLTGNADNICEKQGNLLIFRPESQHADPPHAYCFS